MISLSFTDAAQLVATKANLLARGINLDDFIVFKQIQLKTGKTINSVKNGVTTNRDEYMIADFLLIKVEKNASGGITKILYDDVTVLEAKVTNGSSDTYSFTNPQITVLNNTGTGLAIDVRSIRETSIFSPDGTVQNITNAQKITPTQFYKIWSIEGKGRIIEDLKRLK